MKPIVTYKSAYAPSIEVGNCALLAGVENHPAGLRGECVRTSKIVRVGGDFGEFETLNTIYRQKQEPK